MTKPPSKPGSEQEPKSRRSETAEMRSRTQVAKPTMLEHLLANPQAYGGDEIKVWVQTHLERHTDEFDAGLEQHLEEIGFFLTFREVLQVSEGAPLAPGQVFLLFRASDPRFIRVYLCRASPDHPGIVFQGVTFTVYHPMVEYQGSEVGNPRPFVAAAKRVLEETGGKDWFGGIGEFAAKYLQPPGGRKTVLH